MPRTKDGGSAIGDRSSPISLTTTTSSLAPSASLTAFGSPLHRKRAYKYVKPRIGSNFQCVVPPTPSEEGQDGKEEGSDLEKNCQRDTVPKRRKAGRPSKRGRLGEFQCSGDLILHSPLRAFRECSGFGFHVLVVCLDGRVSE